MKTSVSETWDVFLSGLVDMLADIFHVLIFLLVSVPVLLVYLYPHRLWVRYQRVSQLVTDLELGD
jgi:hypothetical protein